MTSNDYRVIIRRLGLSQTAAASFLAVSARTSRRWASGDAPVDPTAAKLLRVMLDIEHYKDGWEDFPENERKQLFHNLPTIESLSRAPTYKLKNPPTDII